tara:strand:- start:139 stop:783 length:645 start_codon:yes stop_codon:yes gene_type:complete
VEPPFDLAETDRLLSTTRSVRKRLDFTRPVEREVVLDCVRLSQQAPTGSNTQKWAWLLVDEAERRRRLGDLYRELADAMFGQARQAFANDVQTERVYSSVEYLGEHMGDAPLLAIPCVAKDTFGELAAGNAAGAVTYGSIFPAVWSFMLALRSRGLGSTLTTMHLVRERECAELLGIPEDYVQVGLIPVAYTIGTDFKPAMRPSPETITHWNQW